MCVCVKAVSADGAMCMCGTRAREGATQVCHVWTSVRGKAG